MNLKKAIDVLEYYGKCRMDSNIPNPTGKQLVTAINIVTKHYRDGGITVHGK